MPECVSFSSIQTVPSEERAYHIILQVSIKKLDKPDIMTFDLDPDEKLSLEKLRQGVKHLKEKKTIILNLHLLDKEQSIRIVDFLCGATHALNGNQQKIGDTVFIFTPSNVSLSAESQKSKFIRDALWNQPQ